MTTLKNQLKVPFLLAIAILSGITACSQEKISNSNGETEEIAVASVKKLSNRGRKKSSSYTNDNSVSNQDTFICEELEQPNTWGTFAQRGTYVSDSPMINWQTLEFDEWTPKERCFHVSEKLTKAVRNNGGRLSGLVLTYGTINTGQTVICALDANQTQCDRKNMLFTLNKKNAEEPSLVLSRLANFEDGKAANNEVIERGKIQMVELETLVDRSFKW